MKRNCLRGGFALVVSLAMAMAAYAENFTKTYEVTECQDYDLITRMLVGESVALQPSGVKIPQTSNVQIGVFSNLVAQVIPSFTNGVILSTGKITDGPSTSNTDSAKSWPDDALPSLGFDSDMSNYFAEDLADPAGIILYVQPKNRTLNIPFVMASEEYYYYSDSVDSPTLEEYELYSDKFAFFIKELGDASDPTLFDENHNVIDDGSPMTENLAKLPNGDDVSIATVNQHTNTEYFVANVVSNAAGNLEFPAEDIKLPMEFNGAIVGPIAVVNNLDTNKVYKLKIVVGDSYDNTVNSAIFLRERGITSGADLKIDVAGTDSLSAPGAATVADTVSNIGPVAADGVSVRHYLPVGVGKDDVSISCSAGVVDPAGWGVDGGTNYLLWVIGDGFAPGSNAVMTVEYPLASAGTHTSVAAVETTTGDYDESNNRDEQTTVVGAPPPLVVTAICTNKVYGSELAIENLAYVFSIDGMNAAQTATGIDVAFTNALGQAVDPTRADTPVGTYGIVLSNLRGTGLDGCDVIYQPGVLTIEKRAITIKASDRTKTYGQELFFFGTEFFISAGSLADGDSIDEVTLASDGAAATAAYRADGYPIEVSDAQGTGLGNYEITYADGLLTITKRAITITANDRAKTYGEAVVFAGTEFTITSGALADGDAVTAVTLASDGAAATAAYRADGYPIEVSAAQGTGLDNYEITYADGLLTVEKVSLTITANDRTKTYGEAVVFAGTEFTITSGTLADGDSIDAVTLASAGAAATAAYRADGYPIVASDAQGTGLANYAITYADGLLTITKRAITITANDRTKTYGEAVVFEGTEFAITSGSLADGDSIDAVTLASDGAAATAAYRAGGYPIEASAAQGTGLDNYEITYEDGLLTITKRAITITANDRTKTYGEAVVFAGTEFAITSGSLADGDTVTAVTLASAGAAATAAYRADGYPIVVSDAQGTGLANYAITYEDGLLTVEKRAITIKASDRTKTYGQELLFFGTEFAITSGTLADGDSIDEVTLASDGAAATAAYRAGGYPIVVSDAQGTGLGNYEITYADGLLTITKLSLTITANDRTKTYGDAVVFAGTEFTITSGTLLTGDTVTSVTLASAGAAATAAYRADGYPIVASEAQGTGLGNYEITYEDGLLTVEKLSLTITANDRTKTYGDAVVFAGTEFAITSGSLANGDAVTAVTLASDGAAATAAYRADGYPIKASDAQGTGLANYAITYADGLLTIEKRAITITANDRMKTYGEAVVFAGTEFTITSGSLAVGDAVTAVTLASDGAAATAAYRAGGYPIEASAAQGTGLDNYEITYEDGLLTITKRAITITANDRTKTYGEAVVFEGTEFAITSGSLADGDSIDAVTLASDGAAATAPYRTDGYPIVPSAARGTGLGNYAITYADGLLTITRLSLTITANDRTKTYGEAVVFEGTNFTITAGTLLTGDKVTSVTLESDGAAATAPCREGGYPIRASAAQGDGIENYSFTYIDGTLTVTQALLTVTVKDARWPIGKARPANGFEDFTLQLKAGDTVADVTGGSGLASDVMYTNVVWTEERGEPTDADVGIYTDEIGIDIASLDGPRAGNYLIAVEPGDLTIDSASAELHTTIAGTLNWNTGLIDLTLTIANKGDGEVDPEYDYWVELKPGPAAAGTTTSVEKSYYLASPTGTMPDGFNYVNLTARVKAALRTVGNRDEIFDPGETVTVNGVSVYHWKRWQPSLFIDAGTFFVAGLLFNPADTNGDFVVSEAEKVAAEAMLGASSSDYLEVTRLALLPYYHWNTEAETWK
ncbi:MAG: MBG domain-containing protein [Kiritimatiellia bacterium]